jgi:hypothetical protein
MVEDKIEIPKLESKDIPKVEHAKKQDIPKVVEIELPNGSSPTKAKRKYKPRQTKAKKPEAPVLGEAEISALISGMFSLVALKGGEQWNITTDEATQVSKPLSNILQKMDYLEKVSNVSDGAMLIMAMGMLLIPRIIITSSISKKKKGKGVKNNGKVNSVPNSQENESGSTQGKNEPNNKGNDQSATDGRISTKSLLSTSSEIF